MLFSVTIIREDASDPAGLRGFSQLQPSDYVSHRIAHICEKYWGRNEQLADLKPGEVIWITAQTPSRTDYRLYFFEQYRYMQERIDNLYAINTEKKFEFLERNSMSLVYDNAGAVVGGTPGIGENGPSS